MDKVRLSGFIFQCVLFALIVTVLVQAAQQVRKYLGRQVTLSRSSETFSELHLPDVSICPGFKRQKVLQQHQWMRWISRWGLNDNTSFPRTKEEAEALWDDVTYDVDEIILEVGLHKGGTDGVEIFTAKDLLQRNTSHCISVLEHDTLSGRCYSVRSHCSFNKVDTLIVYLNLSLLPNSVTPVFFHHEKAYIGLNENYWPVSVGIKDVNFEEFLDITLRKYIRKRNTPSTEEDFYRCLENDLKDSVNAVASNLCYFPAFRTILEHAKSERFPPCSNVTDYMLSYKKIKHLMLDYTNLDCPRPNNHAVYYTKRRTQRAIMDQNLSVLNVYFETLEVTLEEDYVLLDFPALLAAIGGFIGMLLGWSAKDLARIFSDMLQRDLP